MHKLHETGFSYFPFEVLGRESLKILCRECNWGKGNTKDDTKCRRSSNGIVIRQDTKRVPLCLHCSSRKLDRPSRNSSADRGQAGRMFLTCPESPRRIQLRSPLDDVKEGIGSGSHG